MSFPKRAPPDEVAAGMVRTVRDHTEPAAAQGRAIFVDLNGIRDGFWAAALIVKVNKGPYLPVFEELISRHVVHGGVKAHVLDGKGGHMLFQFMESDNETYGIMPLSTGEPQQQRNVGMEVAVMAGELEQGVSEKVFVKVTVPSPGSIRVREMPWGV